jgi:NADH:ubiquinone oxidoreductase subunit 2 (subunit N)
MAGMPPLSGFLGKLLVLDAIARAGRDRLGLVRDPDRDRS